MKAVLGFKLRDFIESVDYLTQSEVIRESLRLLREKQAESRLQALRDLLAEGLSSGEPVAWEKDAFLKKLKLVRGLPVKTVKLTPKASQDLEDIWYYGHHHFGEEQADRYINKISDIFQVMSDHNIGTPRPELGEYIFALPVERHMIYFMQTDTEIIIIRILSQGQITWRNFSLPVSLRTE